MTLLCNEWDSKKAKFLVEACYFEGGPFDEVMKKIKSKEEVAQARSDMIHVNNEDVIVYIAPLNKSFQFEGKICNC